MADVEDIVRKHTEKLSAHRQQLADSDRGTPAPSQTRGDTTPASTHGSHASSAKPRQMVSGVPPLAVGGALDGKESAASSSPRDALLLAAPGDAVGSGVAADPRANGSWSQPGSRRSQHPPGGAVRHPRQVSPKPIRPRSSRGGSPRATSSPRLHVSHTPYVVDSPTSVYERTQRWQSQRDKAVQRQLNDKSSHELADCTFRPETGPRPGRSGSAEGGASSGNGAVVGSGDTASYYDHVQRHAWARRDREEAQKRTTVDTTKWTPRKTAPKEFEFNRRAVRIPALRKPCLGPPDYIHDALLEDDEEEEEEEEIYVQEESSPTRKPQEEEDEFAPAKRAPEPRPATSSRSAATTPAKTASHGASRPSTSTPAKSTTTTSAAAQRKDAGRPRSASAASISSNNKTKREEPSGPPKRAGGATAAKEGTELAKANREIASLTRDLMIARTRAERQDDEVARLGAQVVSLKREVDAAKSKLRQFALAGSSARGTRAGE